MRQNARDSFNNFVVRRGLHFCLILLVFSDISGADVFAIRRAAAYRARRVEVAGLRRFG
jgi:hypothetical protein